MKIRIFDAAERDFTGYGLGPLPDAVSALVTEERNGAFDLEMEYPLNGIGADKLEPGRILFCKARPGDTTGEPFRIYKTEKRLVGTVTVWAHHISYDLNSEVFLGELNTVKTGIVAACNALNSDRATNTSMIRIWYDGINTSDPVQYDVGTIKMMSEALAGGEGSLLSAFGGELKYQYDPVLHREDVILCATRGNQIMQGIRYGFNLTEFDQMIDAEEQVTDITAYLDKEENGSTQRRTEAFTLVVGAQHVRRMLIDVSGEVEWGATRAQIEAAVTKILKGRDVTLPEEDIKASFVPWKADGLDETKIGLCDTIRIKYPAIGVNKLLKIVRVVYNVLTDHYDKVELGSIRQNVADTIARMEKKAEYKKPSMTIVTDNVPYLTRATAADSVLEMLNKIVGATVAWNQKFKATNASASISGKHGLTVARVSGKFAFTVSGTYSYVSGDRNIYVFSQNPVIPVISGHKYLFTNTSQYLCIYLYGATFSGNSLNRTPTGGVVVSATSSANLNIYLHCGTNIANNTVIDETVFINGFDLTLMFGSTIADYIYSLEQNTTGAGVAFFRSIFGKTYYEDDEGTLQSVKTSAHVTKDGNGNVLGSYPIQDIDVRGFMELSDGKIVYDGDKYASNGTVTRKYGIVDLGTLTFTYTSGVFRFTLSSIDAKAPESAYVYPNAVCDKYTSVPSSVANFNGSFKFHPTNGYGYISDSNYTDAATFKTAMSGVYLVYELATPTTESASAFTQSQICDPNGSEEFIDGRDAEIPVGHITDYIVVQ